MNDTPKTDSHLKALRDEGAYTDPTAVSVDFARDLERENTKLLAAMTWIRIEAEKHPEIGCRIILEIANKALATANDQALRSAPTVDVERKKGSGI